MADRSDTLRKVQALLDKANGTNFDAERDAFLAKADALMAKYAIESFELEMAKPAQMREKPVVRDVTVSTAQDFQVRYQLESLFQALASHVGVLIGATKYSSTNQRVFVCVGYESDLEYLQMLYVTIQMHLVGRMEPHKDADLSDLENFTVLREAGLDYNRIRDLMGWRDGDGNIAKMRKAYKKQCAEEGRAHVEGAKGESYRLSFLTGYVRRIKARLEEMAQARVVASDGKGLVLASRDGDIKETLWEAFPDQRPHPDDCQCENCHYIRCNDINCTRPACVEYRKMRRKPVRYRAPRQVKLDHQAYSMGTSIANSADLSGGRGKVGGSNKELS